MKATMTVTVEPKTISVTLTNGGKTATSTMTREGPGSWKGAVKAAVTEKAFEKAFPDCNPEEINDIVDDLFSKGMDLHNELMMDDD